jgi:hypothetical protein
LLVRAGGSDIRLVTPPDGYADEKAFDRRVFRQVLDACRAQGVADCRDETG